jgi:hypothetical protein
VRPLHRSSRSTRLTHTHTPDARAARPACARAQHDLVPRFSIHNVFSLKEEMDATDWGSILLNTAKDWAVPDVIENSETFKKLAAGTTKQVRPRAHGPVCVCARAPEAACHAAADLRRLCAAAVWLCMKPPHARARVCAFVTTQAGALGRAAANGYLALQSAVVSGLHFAGLVKPNPGASKGAAAGAGEGMSAGDAATVQQAVETVGEKMANTKKVCVSVCAGGGGGVRLSLCGHQLVCVCVCECVCVCVCVCVCARAHAWPVCLA